MNISKVLYKNTSDVCQQLKGKTDPKLIEMVIYAKDSSRAAIAPSSRRGRHTPATGEPCAWQQHIAALSIEHYLVGTFNQSNNFL